MLTIKVLLLISLFAIGRASESEEPALYYYGIVSIPSADWFE